MGLLVKTGAKITLPLILALFIVLSGCVMLGKPSITAGPACGNLECEAGEDSTTCPQDCGICTDSDGVNYFTAGTTTDGTGASISDSCTAGILTEGLCYQNLAYSFKRPCDLGCNAAGTACEGTGSEVLAGQYCFYPNPENPADPNLNQFLELAQNVCHPTTGVEEVWTCATGASGNAEFQIVEDCALRSPAEACVEGTCQWETGLCLYACCSNADCGSGQSCQNPATTSSQCVSDPTLVLSYSLDNLTEPVTIIPDESGNNNTGAQQGATYLPTGGVAGGADYFDTNTVYVSVADSPSLRIPSSWTASAWVKLNAWPALNRGMVVVGKGDAAETAGRNHNYLLGIENDVWGTGNAVTALLENSASANSQARGLGSLTTGVWHHVAGVYDDAANVIKVYVDGAFKASAAASITAADTGTPCVTIGKDSCDLGASWADALGTVDNVKIYRRALDSDEIYKLYLQGQCATQIACYSNSDCGTNATCQNAGICGSAQCVQCAPACTSDLNCSAGDVCAKAGTCDALCATPDASMVLFYDFENSFAGTTVADASGNGNNGMPLGGVYHTYAGKLGYGADFNGINGAISPLSPNPGPLHDAFTEKTIAMWIKADITTATQTLYDEGDSTNGIALQIKNTGAIYFYTQNAGIIKSVNTAFTDTVNWHHVAGVFDKNKMALYLDGVSKATLLAGFVTVSAHSGEPGIGDTNVNDASDATTANYFNGRMDEVRVYNRALSLMEIQELYNNCNIACDTNASCNDSNPATIDTCNNPNTCSAGCSYCTPVCQSDAECDDGNITTSDACIGIGTCTASCENVGPLVHYKFEDSASPTPDSSGKGNHGTLLPSGTGPTWTSSAVVGTGAYTFDGADDYVDAGDSNDFRFGNTTPFTISTWVYPEAANSYRTIVAYDPTDNAIGDSPSLRPLYVLRLTPSNAIGAKDAPEFWFGNYSTTCQIFDDAGTTPISLNEWHHVAVVRDVATDKVRKYIDGVETIATDDSECTWSVSNESLKIGRLKTASASQMFKGKIDDVYVYNHALTAAEVQQLRTLGCVPACVSKSGCDDSNPLTLDVCNNPRQCDASCSNTACTPACSSSAECSAGKTCLRAGTCDSACTAIFPGTVLFYDFEDDFTGATVADVSGNGLNGAPSGKVYHASSGKTGYGADFDGFDGFVTVASPSPGPLHDAYTQKTVAMWIKADDTSSGQKLYYEGGSLNYIALGFTTNLIMLYVGNGAGSTSKQIGTSFTDTSNWHHVAGVFDNNQLMLYLDGQLKASGQTSYASIGSHTENTLVGKAPSGEYFNGKMDDLVVFNRALSEGEIQMLRLGCTTPIECFNDYECDDSDSLTANICNNPGTCSASCSYPPYSLTQASYVVWTDLRNWATPSYSDIYMYDLNKGTEKRLVGDVNSLRHSAIHGTRIVYEERYEFSDIYMYDLNTNTQTLLTNAPYDQTVPEIYGDWVVWEDQRNYATAALDIYAYNISSRSTVRITGGSGTSEVAPAIHGTRVVWDEWASDDIYMCDLSRNGSSGGCLLADAKTPVSPAAVGDQGMADIFGNTVVWQDSRNGNWDIYMYDISAGTETRVTTDASTQAAPKIYGNLIVWLDYRNTDQNGDIYMYDIATGTETRITANTARKADPFIYGNIIVWYDYRNHPLLENPDIYSYNLTTGTESLLVPSPPADPSSAPDEDMDIG